jgi:hypothetical protein
METKTNIEDQINRALNSVKNTESVELPYGFSDKVMSKLHSKESKVRNLYSVSPLLKWAAMFILILVNVFTLKLAFAPQPAQKQAQYITIKDFVNSYQINDSGDELVSINTPAHE